jgi:hypothetical protein
MMEVSLITIIKFCLKLKIQLLLWSVLKMNAKDRAIKYGRIKGRRPIGHGGARGNGNHLRTVLLGETEEGRRVEYRIKKELLRNK